jgi:hypothetical protein
MDHKDLIKATLEDLVEAFLRWDRERDVREDVDDPLPRGSIEQAVADGVLSVEEMVQIFSKKLHGEVDGVELKHRIGDIVRIGLQPTDLMRVDRIEVEPRAWRGTVQYCGEKYNGHPGGTSQAWHEEGDAEIWAKRPRVD